MKAIFIFIITFSLSFNMFSQQSYLSNFYMINPYLINPAETDNDDSFTSFLSLREQWVGVEGAPSTAFLTASMPLSNKFSAGIKITNDNIHLYNQLNALATLNYKLKISENQNFHFAISSGVINNKLDTKKAVVNDESDILFYQDLSGVAFNADFGLKYDYIFQNKNILNVGFSANNLLANKIKFELNDTQGSEFYTLNRDYNFYLNYIYKSVNNWEFKPMVLFRLSELDSKYQTEVGFLSTYKKMIWVSLIYRTNESIYFGLGVNLFESVSIGYSYGYGVNGISANSNGTHEISVAYSFKPKKTKNIDTLVVNNDIYKVDTLYIKDTITLRDTITKIDSVIVQQKIGDVSVDFKVEKGLHLVYGSYKMIDNANRELLRLKSLGIKASILIDSTKSYQRIIVGSFSNDNDALIELSELNKKGLNGVWIWRIK